jgi:predicted tellurium resistance membrane protein TerC
MIELLADPQTWAALLALTALELVIGIHNIIFISILADRLPPAQRTAARRIGLFLAMSMRIGLLLALSWLVRLPEPMFTMAGTDLSGRDLILISGGLFLAWTSTDEIHNMLEGDAGDAGGSGRPVQATLAAVIAQIVVVDIVFSLDSIVTALGMVEQVPVLVAAVVVSVGLMMLLAPAVGRVVSDHPTLKMLALAFLLVVGVVLIADAFDHRLPKGFVYVAMAFSVGVEVLNIRFHRGRGAPAKPRDPHTAQDEPPAQGRPDRPSR